MDLDTICYACGNAVKFLDVKNSTETSFLSEGNGVKKLTANPFESVFAIAEHGINPRIFVYQYPSFELVCTLTGKYSNTVRLLGLNMLNSRLLFENKFMI